MLFVLTLVFLYPALVGGKALLPAEYLSAMHPRGSVSSASRPPQWNPLMWDGIAQFYPWRVHYSRSVANGELPLWNPYQFCGTPFAANAQTAVFYPLNLLFVIFSPVRAFGLSAALHLFLAGAFMFLLARALGIGRFGATVAAVTFEFSAFMIVWLELPTFVNVATWLPLALYLILKSMDRTGAVHAIFAGLVLGISILAGHFQVASYVMGAAALWWIWLIAGRARIDGREAVGRGVLLALTSFAVAFLIAAPQILPTLELAGLSHRVRDVTAEGYTRYVANAVPTRNLITLFVPNFYGNPSTPGNPYWIGSAADFMEYGLYIGLLPLVLAILGGIFTIRWRGTGFFAVLAVLSLLFAFGAPINYITYHLVPGTSALGGPNRVIILFCFSAAMLAGFGAHWFLQLAQEEYKATHRKLGWRALVVGAAALALVFLMSQFIANASISALGIEPARVVAAAQSQYLSFGSLLIAGLAVLALYTAGYLPKPVFAGLALAVIVGDLFSFGMGFNPTAPPERVYPKTQLIKWIQDNVGTARLMPINSNWSLYQHPDAILPPNAATVYGFYDMQGYDSLFPRRYKEFVDTRLQTDSSPPENGNMLFIKSYVTGWPKGTAGYVLSKEPLKAPELNSLFSSDEGHIYELRAEEPYQDTYLLPPSDGSIKDSSRQPSGRAWVASRSPNQIIVTANADSLARLVLAQTYYPGWKADVNGMERLVSAEGIFRSVPVEPGDDTVTFRFQPGTYVVGAFLGFLGALAAGTAAGMAIARMRRR